MAFIGRLDHFRFEKDGDLLVITSERANGFEQQHSWPDEYSMTDEDLIDKLHQNYYTQAKLQYENNFE